MKKLFFLMAISAKLLGQNSTNNLIKGVFISNQTKYYNIINCNFNQLKATYGVSAYFTPTATTNINPSLFCKAGTVKYNNEELDYDNSKKFYSETEINCPNQQHWKISGSSSVPAMNFIYSGSLPSFNINQYLINDTIKKSDTLFIRINNIQNADSIMIRISDNDQQSTQHHVALLTSNYTNTYYLVPSILVPLISGPRAVVAIDAIKYNYQTISGNRYLFRNVFSFVRADVKIIN